MKIALQLFLCSWHTALTVWMCCLSGECVPLGCMMINSVARLCPLLQPVSLFSLPNAPSLADLDWEESGTESGKYSPAGSSCGILNYNTSLSIMFVYSTCAQLCRKQANEWALDWTVNIYSRFINAICQGRCVCPSHLISTPGAASSSWIPVVGMAKCA